MRHSACGKQVYGISICSCRAPRHRRWTRYPPLRRSSRAWERRSVVFVQAGDEEEAAKARAVFANEGAESIDAAREEWWIGLRSAEKEHYNARGGNFEDAEPDYRRGFEAALRQSSATAGADRTENEAYRRGYERGTAYHQQQR